MTAQFLDITRRLYDFCQEHALTPPRLTLTFDTPFMAASAWNKILDEFPEWSLHPKNREHVQAGEAGIHGIPIKIEPMP